MVLKTQYLVKEIVESEFRTTTSKDKGCYAFCWNVDFDALPTRRYIEVKFGDAGLKRAGEGDINSRLKNYFNADRKREDMVVIGEWTDLHRIKRDHDVFDSLALIAPRRVGIDEETGKRQKYEKFYFMITDAMIQHYVKTLDRSAIINFIATQIDGVIKNKEKVSKTQLIKFRYIQTKVIKQVMQKLKAGGFNMSLVAELCPRIGKTIIFLELFRRISQEKPQFRTMFIQTYGVGLSIFKSYRDELDRWKDFVGMDLIDASGADAEQQFKNSQKQGRLQVVLVGLNPKENSTRYRWMNRYTGSIVSLLEEADFGCHTDQQVKKTEFINANKQKLIRINASGTNIGRLAKAFGANVATEVISIPYSMVEQDRDAVKNGIVLRKYYNAFFDPKVNKLLEGYGAEDLPTIKKIIEQPWAQEAWLGAVWANIFNSPTAKVDYGLSINQMAGQDIRFAMLFQSGTKRSMDQHKAVIEKHCPEVHVLVLHGDVSGMSNKTAEQKTKEEITRLKFGLITGKSKLLVVTNMMGTRSYTVGELQAVIFMQDGGDIDTFIQRSSRVLSQHKGKKFGHIFDFAFDPNKTRNSEMSIVHDAVLTQKQQGGSFPDAIRTVLKSVNLWDMGRGGWQSDRELVARLEDNNKLLELANSATRFDIKDLSEEQLEILLKIQNTSTAKENKKLKHIMTGKTYKSNGRAGGGDRDILKKQVQKAIQALNNSATSVLWFADKKGDTFAECIEHIKNNKDASIDFTKVIGITPTELQVLIPLLPTNIYDICVENSKSGQVQKYATNTSIGILGRPDPKELWMEIISQAVMDARIRYAMKHNGKILVIAGGHGAEVDVLVEKYGKKVIKHIWFNDSIVSFVNEIKFKYNKINIVKGDFLKLNIDMKFDVILQNPPYQSQKESTGDDIWPFFVEKAVSLLNNDGIVASITPNTWLRRQGSDDKFFESLDYYGMPLDRRTNPVWKIWLENRVSNAKILTKAEADRYFPGIGSTFTYYFIEKKKPVDTRIDIEQGNRRVQIDLNSSYPPPNELNDISISIHEKLLKAEKLDWIRTTENRKDNLERYHQLSDHKTKKHSNKIYMGVNLIRYTGKKMKYFDDIKIMVPITGQPKDIFVDSKCGVSQDFSFVCFKELKRAEQELKKWNKDILIQYIFKAYKVGKHISAHLMIPKNSDKIILTQKEKDYISNYVNGKK